MILAMLLLLQDPSEKVEGLIKKLSDPAARPEAMEELVKIGPPALNSLEKAAKTGDADFQGTVQAVLQKIYWPGMAGLDQIQTSENGEPRIQMEESEGAGYDKLRKLFPDFRVFRLTFATMEGGFSRSETQVLKRLSPEPTNMSKMSPAQKAEWMTRAFQSQGVKLSSEAQVQEVLQLVEIYLQPIAVKAECIREKGSCGGACVVKKVDGGWEYYHESCGEYITLHTIWAAKTDSEGKVEKLILHPEGKKFVLEKK